VISDPRLSKPLAALIAICELAEDWNDPRTYGDRVGSPGKPGSRPPGQQQCERFVQRLAGILDKSVELADSARPDMRPIKAEPVRSVGGVPVTEPQPSEVLLHRRKVRVEVIRGHLVGKMLDTDLTGVADST
jgi:hypothetical protein